MARNEITVEYADGRTETLAFRPRDLIAAERHFKKAGSVPALEGTLYAAWHSNGRTNGTFEAWLDSLEAIVTDTDEDDDRPTAAAGSAET